MGRPMASHFFNLRSAKKILPRLLIMNSMVYNSTIFKWWGYPEKNRDDLGVLFFQPSIGKKNITEVVDHELHGLQFNHI